MDKKTTSWVSYITWVGWIIAFCAGDKEGAKFYLNQSLILWLLYLSLFVIGFIPFIGWIIAWVGYVFGVVCFVLGLIAAIKQEENPLPLIGLITILK